MIILQKYIMFVMQVKVEYKQNAYDNTEYLKPVGSI